MARPKRRPARPGRRGSLCASSPDEPGANGDLRRLVIAACLENTRDIIDLLKANDDQLSRRADRSNGRAWRPSDGHDRHAALRRLSRRSARAPAASRPACLNTSLRANPAPCGRPCGPPPSRSGLGDAARR